MTVTMFPLKNVREAPKSQQSKMETTILTKKEVERWERPPFQRPIKETEKFFKCIDKIQETEVIPGVITLGRITGEAQVIYTCDGQHRSEAFMRTTREEAMADVRIVWFDSMAEMAREFTELNGSINPMKPDDTLRSCESYTPLLRKIRANCPFVGYENIRRNPDCPVVSMSAMLRCWFGSSKDTPSSASISALTISESLETTDIGNLIGFLGIASSAWGKEQENHRLWGSLNLALHMWLYRRLVIEKERGVKRYVILNDGQFKKCAMYVSASGDYVQWLFGRNLTDRDRSPAFGRLCTLFQKSLSEQGVARPRMPAPAWKRDR